MKYSKDFENNLKDRANILVKAKDNKELQILLKKKCEQDPLYFFNVFLWSYKPKAVGNEGEPVNANIPFITYPFQDEYIVDIISCIENSQDSSTEKSREMGFSWMMLGIATYGFLFKSRSGLIGSYKESYVDKQGDMDSAFERMRFILDKLPDWIKPNDLEVKFMSIGSKSLGCQIGGDSGVNFGTGGRRKWVFMDEFALWQSDEMAFRKTKDVTNCRIIGGCVTKDTIIIGKNGLEELGECELGYSKEDKQVYGKDGFHKAIQRFGNGFVDTIKMESNLGYEIEGTPNHKIFTPNGWRRLDELKEGEPLYIQLNQQQFGNKEEDLDFCYFLGLYLAEGTMEYRTINSGRNRDKPYRITISHGDEENIDWLRNKYGFICKDGMHNRLSSVKFMDRLLEYFEHKKAPFKILTPTILSLKKECIIQVLRGYFDGDGYSVKTKRRVGCVTSSEKLSKQIQILLLNLGIQSSRSMHLSQITKKVNKRCIAYRVIMEGYEAYLFHRYIGFKLTRKDEQKEHQNSKFNRLYYFNKGDFGRIKGGNNYNGVIYNKKKKLQLSGFILEKILKDNPNSKYDLQLPVGYVKKLSNSKAETFDFVIPETKQYFGNGFIVHNTPEGKFNVYGKIMTNHPDYAHLKIKKFRLHWTAHPLKTQEWYEHQKETRTKLDVAKELDISYDDSVTGAVYPSFTDKVKIKPVEYDSNLKTYTSWDFGRDMNVVIVWQKDFKFNKIIVLETFQRENRDIDKFAAFITGEPTQGFDYTQDELNEIEYMSNFGQYTNHYGDPYNKDSRTTNAKKTIAEILASLGIHLHQKDKEDKQSSVEDRITKTGLSLNRFVINETCYNFIESMIQSRYPPTKEGSTGTREKTKPIHDENSHIRTACEYFIDHEPIEIKLNKGNRTFHNKISGAMINTGQTNKRQRFGL